MINSWKKYQIKELCDIRRGSSPRPIQKYLSNTGVPWIKISDATKSKTRYIDLTSEFIIEDGKSNSVEVFKGDLILSNSATPGIPKILKIDACIHDGWLLFRNFNGIHKEYLYYQFLIIRDELIQRSNGSVFNNLKTDILKDFEIILPSLPEQYAITEILSALDDKIELNLKTNITLQEMADALYKHWFVKFDPFKNGKFVKTELGSIPQGWFVKPLKEVCTVERGLSYKGEFLAKEGKPLHNLNSIYEGGFYKYPGIKYYSGPYKERNTVSPGDLIVANTEQGHKYLLIGSPALIPKRFGSNGIFSHHLYKIVPNNNSVSKIYLFHWLLQKDNRDRVTAYCNGTTVNMLKPAGFENPSLIVPDMKTIEEFDKIIQPYLDLKEELIEENYTVIQTRDYLLPKLISGEIRIKEAIKKVKEVA